MIRTMLAWLTILAGLWWTLQPQALRSMMTRKAMRMVFCFAAGLLLWPLVKMGWASGPLGILVMIALFGALMIVAGTAVGKIFAQVPILWYQAIGVINIVGGFLILKRYL